MTAKNSSNTVTIFTDGGARGNPGPAACAFVVVSDNQMIAQKGRYLGNATNNYAEYQGVIEALMWLTAHKDEVMFPVTISLDSQLVVNQLQGLFKVKEPTLRTLLLEIKTLEQQVGNAVFYHHIPRLHNSRADQLVNITLNQQLGL